MLSRLSYVVPGAVLASAWGTVGGALRRLFHFPVLYSRPDRRLAGALPSGTLPSNDGR